MRRIGIAVSGGADSTALLVLLAESRAELDFDAVVLHVDHGIRSDSAADVRFVRSLARRFGLPFHSTRLSIIRRRGESIEMAARRERLDFFARMTKRLRLDAIATGHHADDVAETFLLRLARGSGPDGLAGLKRISHLSVPTGNNGESLPITFIRPLLDLRDSQLRDFLRSRNIEWHEDSTNTDLSIPRNKVRRLVIPWLRDNLDPRITEHLCKSAAILRGDLTRPAAEDKCNAAEKHDAKFAPPPAAYTLEVKPSVGFLRAPSRIGELPSSCRLSKRCLSGKTLEFRPWSAGDRIAPTGMDGKSRKLQDVFVTAKVPPSIRANLPVLALADSHTVLWVPGYRIAETAAVETESAPSWEFTLSDSRGEPDGSQRR